MPAKTIKVRDLISSGEVRTFTGHNGGVTGVAFSPDGKRVVSGSQDNTLKIWDAATGKLLYRIKHESKVNHCLFGNNNLLITVGGVEDEGFVRVRRIGAEAPPVDLL